MAQTHSLDLEASSSQYAYVADSAALEISGDMTFEAWVKFETLPAATGGSMYIANRDPDDNANRVWALRVVESGGQYKLGAYNSSGGTNATTSGQVSSSAFNLTAGTWYHLAWVFSGGNLKSYVNGLLINSASGLNASMYTGGSSQLTIGAYDTGVSNFFDGLVKDVRIFNDERTAAEILADAHTQNVSNANLVGEWNFNNAYTDTSGNGNTLTSGGSPIFSTNIPWEAAPDISGSTYLETSLQGFWTLDEASGTRLDSTANNNDLTDNNTVLGAAGKINNGADFELSNSEWLSITNAAQTGLGVTTDFSISVWIKLEQLPSTAGTDFDMVDKAFGGGDSGYRFFLSSDDKIRLYYWNATADTTDYSTGAGVVSGDVGTFVHFVVSVDLDGSIRIFKNGVEIPMTADAARATTILNGTNDFTIGKYSAGASSYFDGIMDEIGFYSRALHYGDVLDLYNGGSGLTFSISTDVSVAAGVVTGTLSLPASTVSGGATVSPTAVVGTLSVQAPTVSGGATVSADVVSGTFSLPTPDIQTPDAYISADVISATFSIPAPTVTAIENVSISSDLLTGTLSLPAATVVIAVSVASDVLTAVFTLPEATVTAIGNVTVSPNALTGTFSLPVSTVEAIQHITISADTVAGTFSLPAPTITAIRTVVISADLLTGVLSLPVMTIVADQWQPQYTEPTATSWGAQYGGVGSVSWDNKY